MIFPRYLIEGHRVGSRGEQVYKIEILRSYKTVPLTCYLIGAAMIRQESPATKNQPTKNIFWKTTDFVPIFLIFRHVI